MYSNTIRPIFEHVRPFSGVSPEFAMYISDD